MWFFEHFSYLVLFHIESVTLSCSNKKIICSSKPIHDLVGIRSAQVLAEQDLADSDLVQIVKGVEAARIAWPVYVVWATAPDDVSGRALLGRRNRPCF